MASRVKIILENKEFGQKVTGMEARQIITRLLGDKFMWKEGLPNDWGTKTYVQKLRHFKSFLPPGWVLEIYIEPKATAPKKSLFKKNIKGPEPENPRQRVAAGMARNPLFYYDVPPVRRAEVVGQWAAPELNPPVRRRVVNNG